jgi:hypothetical protein
MKVYSHTINSDLLAFWQENAVPGRIGLIHIDLITARLINWAQQRVTVDGAPSSWTHCFMFLDPRGDMPWITESDVRVPLPGFRPKPSGPQENPVDKWALEIVDRAVLVDPGLTPEQWSQLQVGEKRLLTAGYTYRYQELFEAWVALLKKDLAFRSPLHRDDSMHCGHYLRVLLQTVGIDPYGPSVLPENTVPELFSQVFPIVAEWSAPSKT